MRSIQRADHGDLGTRDATIVLAVMALLVGLIVAFLVLPVTPQKNNPEDQASATAAESPATEELDHVSRH